MFGALTEKFTQLLGSMAGKKALTEENISEAIRQVRLALLDADVNYSVAGQFVKKVKERALGETVLRSLTPGQMFIEIVHEELVLLMGGGESALSLRGDPSVILLCGLQGSGKTTQCAKLGYYLQKQNPKRKILLAACDLQRSAAIEQLRQLGVQAGIPVFWVEGESNPCKVAKLALEEAKKQRYDVLIVDTAGRLHIDETLMKELSQIKETLQPEEILFVASANMGQDAVKTAQEFDRSVSITGSILTMLDGSARAGAAISICEVTQKPLKFEGIGEKLDDLQLFHPKSMTDRILGMGDVLNLTRKMREIISEKEEEELEEKLRKASFTYTDYLKQMTALKKMGPLQGLLKMFPGMPALDQLDIGTKKLQVTEAIILSMTPKERDEKVDLIPSRRKRIADGSGVHVDEVNQLIKQFKKMKQMIKDMPALQKQMKKSGKKENFLWR